MEIDWFATLAEQGDREKQGNRGGNARGQAPAPLGDRKSAAQGR